MKYKKAISHLSLSATPDSSVLFQQQSNAAFRRVCSIISGHYLSAVYLNPTAVDSRQMETIQGYIWKRAGWAERWKLAVEKYNLKHIMVEAEQETPYPNITPAKRGWTRKIKWLHWASWQTVRKAPLLHLFSLSISNVKGQLGSVFYQRRILGGSLLSHATSVYHIALRDRQSGALQMLFRILPRRSFYTTIYLNNLRVASVLNVMWVTQYYLIGFS